MTMSRIEWPQSKGDDMIYTADLFLRHHPSLRQLTLKRLRPMKPQGWIHLDDLRLVRMGMYEVVEDGKDNVKMLVREWWVPSRTSLGAGGHIKGGRLHSHQKTDEAIEFEPRQATMSDSRALVLSRGRR